MTQTIDSTAEIVAQTKCHFERFSGRLIHLLAFVPDDKLTWTPSPTAKSSLRIAAHCALTSKFFADVITGSLPESMPSPEQFFKEARAAEEKIITRESAIALIKVNTAELSSAIDTVNTKNIDLARNSPFGSLPLRFWIDQGGEQMEGHAGQMEYLQTIWGDLDNHYD